MKNIYIIIFVIISPLTHAQLTNVWQESFIGFTDNTGVTVQGGAIINTGDYTPTSLNWTLDASSINLGNDGAGAQVMNLTNGVYNPRLVAQNTNGDIIWESEQIDISSFTESFLSILVSRIGDLSENDYLDVYWRVGSSSFIMIDDDSDGHTIVGVNGDDCWDTQSIEFNLTTTTQTTTQIRVVMNTTTNTGSVAIDKVLILGGN